MLCVLHRFIDLKTTIYVHGLNLIELIKPLVSFRLTEDGFSSPSIARTSSIWHLYLWKGWPQSKWLFSRVYFRIETTISEECIEDSCPRCYKAMGYGSAAPLWGLL